MIKRTLEVSGPETRLSLRNGQIVVRRGEEQTVQTPAEDVGVLIVDTPTANYTHGTLVELLKHGAVVVLCGDNHTPVSIVTPLEGNAVTAERLRSQIEASEPTRKRLWQEIVRAKIRGQAALAEAPEVCLRLERMACEVKSGDPQNVEAQAARIHWGSWLGASEAFRRERHGLPPNNLLNYGYMALRAAVARALCGAGLHPSLGLKHSSRYNALALADDLLEPFRPMVDCAVRSLWRNGVAEIGRPAKEALLSLFTQACRFDEQTGPLLVALERMCASLVRCFAGEEKNLKIPEIVWNGANGEPCG